MENRKVIQFMDEVVTEEIRKGNLVKSKDVLTMLPELIDTVHIDRKKMRGSIERCLSTSNPLNAILSLFGVQFIKKEKAINRLLNSSAEQDDCTVEIDDSHAKRWLTLNPTDFREIVEKIANRLFELETQANQTYDNEKKRGDDLFGKYEKLLKDHNQLKYSAESNEKLVAERIQYILSLAGKQGTSSNEQLVELLKDLNIEVYWNSAEAPFADAAMFTEYAVDDETLANTKPCLIRNGVVFVKGIRFVKK